MSKRMSALKQLIDKNRVYPISEAIELVKKTSNVKFNSSVEVHVRLGINVGKSDQQIRSTVILPHGIGKTKRVAAFVGPNDEKTAKEACADFVYGEEDIKKIKDTGKFGFDVAVATPEMMPKLAPAAKILGPKGLMPNPKTGTVGTDIKKMVGELKTGKVTLKNDETGNLHQIIGKVNFESDKLKENFETLIEALKRAKPGSAKGTYLRAVYLTSSMGPSVKVEIGA